MEYPFNVFPQAIQQSIIDISAERSLSPAFVATAGLWTVSSLAGTRYYSDFNGDARNILFCLMIGPVSVGKTPAFKVMCQNPLSKLYARHDMEFRQALGDYEEEKNNANNNRQSFNKKRPRLFIPFAEDGTTEGYLNTCSYQINGMGIYQDEAETIFNAGNFKNVNDSISFFTQAFSGGRVTQIRAEDSKTRVIPDLNLNLLMGTQPSRLRNIFTEDRLNSGFASRFLMVQSDYIELNTEADPFSPKKEMCDEWVDLVGYLYTRAYEYNQGLCDKTKVHIDDSAKTYYRQLYKINLIEANNRIKSKSESYIIGAEAKMSAYFPRLCQILAIIHSPQQPVVSISIIEKAWQLYKYYATQTINVISNLHTEIETGLPQELDNLYNALPFEFTRKEAVEICEKININERRFDVSMRRKDFAAMFVKIEQGRYRKK